MFDRMHVAFDCCKKGFIVGCRRVISLDGCFLKGLIKQKLLVIINRDTNNKMFPVALVVMLVVYGYMELFF